MRLLTLFMSLFWFSSYFGGGLSLGYYNKFSTVDTSFLPDPPIFKGDTLYFLIDRNSVNVKYNEYYVDLPYSPNLNHKWTFKSIACKWGNTNDNVEFTFYCRQPTKPYWQYCHIERKPLSFLDSITYHDEKWLLYHDRSLVNIVNSNHTGGPIQPPKARILDKATISNDSITMYEAWLDWNDATCVYFEIDSLGNKIMHNE